MQLALYYGASFSRFSLWDKDLATIGHRRRPEDSSEETGQNQGTTEADRYGAEGGEKDGGGPDRLKARHRRAAEDSPGGRKQPRRAKLQADRIGRLIDETLKK